MLGMELSSRRKRRMPRRDMWMLREDNYGGDWGDRGGCTQGEVER